MEAEPGAETACELASTALGKRAIAARRFETGLRHFVYEVELEARTPVVVRISREADRGVCRSSAYLSHYLRQHGVPLPELICDGSEAACPFLIMERLPGRDLGFVVGSLTAAKLEALAHRVAAIQEVVMSLPVAGRYGFAPKAEEAPFVRWTEVLWEHLHRTERRLAAAGLFDASIVNRCAELLRSVAADADQVRCTPFLHDTTTKNVIVTEEGELSGIVDVDDLCYGDPRRVAALTLASLSAGWAPGPTEYVSSWMSALGWRDDRLFRVYVALYVADFMSELGLRFNKAQTTPGADQRRLLQDAFERAIAAAA